MEGVGEGRVQSTYKARGKAPVGVVSKTVWGYKGCRMSGQRVLTGM